MHRKSNQPIATGTPEQRLRACEPPAETINSEHEAALVDAASAIRHAIRCGELLIEQKEAIGEKRGGDRRSSSFKGEARCTFGFKAWCDERLVFDYRQAANYMRAARNKDLIESMAVESLRGALAALSSEPLDGETVDSKAAAWAAEINALARKLQESYLGWIFERGDALCEAEDDLPHDEFEALLESVRCRPKFARRLMTIARDKRLRNPAHTQHLPPDWEALYAITKLTDAQFNRGILFGIIRFDVEPEELRAVKDVGGAA